MKRFSLSIARAASRRAFRQGRQAALEWLERKDCMSADAVLDWNAVALEAQANDHTPSIVAKADQGGPTKSARALAIVHAAIYDAVNSIDQSYTPYLVTKTFSKIASIDAAVAQAAHDALVALYPSQKTMFDTALRESLADIRNGVSETLGRSAGRFVARAILAARQTDGSEITVDYTEGTAPGEHRVDPLNTGQGYLTPGWGDVDGFAIQSTSEFLPPPPPELTSEEYAAAFQEVKDYGGDGVTTPTLRTAEQTEIGIFWGYDGRPELGAPPRLYNQIARVIAIQEGNTEIENARMFALINIAQADAGVVAWDAKYDHNFWRPVVAIREADEGTGPSGLGDGNAATEGDPNWRPLGAPGSNGGVDFTPPFPGYISGHATFGAAVFETLANFYGRDDISFSFTSDEFNGVTTDAQGNVRPVVTRTFDSFSEAAAENAQSRIYLGVHWSFDATEGIRSGNAIADYVFSNILQPRTQPPGNGLDLEKIREVLSSVIRSDRTIDAVIQALSRLETVSARVERTLDRLENLAEDQSSSHGREARQIQRHINETVQTLLRELGLSRRSGTSHEPQLSSRDEVFGCWA